MAVTIIDREATVSVVHIDTKSHGKPTTNGLLLKQDPIFLFFFWPRQRSDLGSSFSNRNIYLMVSRKHCWFKCCFAWNIERRFFVPFFLLCWCAYFPLVCFFILQFKRKHAIRCLMGNSEPFWFEFSFAHFRLCLCLNHDEKLILSASQYNTPRVLFVNIYLFHKDVSFSSNNNLLFLEVYMKQNTY